MNRRTALQFVQRHGIILESAHGPVVTFADAVAGERSPHETDYKGISRTFGAGSDALTGSKMLTGKDLPGDAVRPVLVANAEIMTNAELSSLQ